MAIVLRPVMSSFIASGPNAATLHYIHNDRQMLSGEFLLIDAGCEVDFYASDPRWAAEFVNKLVAHHIERRAKLSQQSEARRFFESQRDVRRVKLEQTL